MAAITTTSEYTFLVAPKIKFYFSVKKLLPDRTLYDATEAQLQKTIDDIIADMKLN